MRLLISFTIILFMVTFLSDAFAQFDTGTTTKTDILQSNENGEIEARSDFESSTTGSWKLPSGTEAQRPDPADSGMIRYNSEANTFEGFVVDSWGPIAGGGGLSTFEASFSYNAGDYIEEDDKVFRANADFTSGATFDTANWTLVSPIRIDFDDNDKFTFARDNIQFELGSRNPEYKNFLNHPHFAEGQDGTCDGAGCSAAFVSSLTAPDDEQYLTGGDALKITFTSESCYTYEHTFEGEQVQANLAFNALAKNLDVTDDITIEVYRKVGASEIETTTFDVKSSNWIRKSIAPFQGNEADGVGFKVCGTTGDLIINNMFLGIKPVNTAPFKNCSDDLDCENIVKAIIQTDGTVTNDEFGFINGNCTKVATGRYSCPIVGFSEPPFCFGIANDLSADQNSVSISTENTTTATTLDLRHRQAGIGLIDPVPSFKLFCHKQGDDYKPTTEQGVLTKEQFVASVTAWGSNGGGSDSGNRIRRFSNFERFGNKFVEYTDSATGGASFEILQDGYYSITYTDSTGFSGAADICISLNSTDLSSLPSGSGKECIGTQTVNAASNRGSMAFSGNLKKGDIVRGSLGTTSNGSVPLQTRFSITKLPFAQMFFEIQNKLEYGEKGTANTTCVIRQTSISSTAVFESVPSGCADFSGASRTANGVYSGLNFSTEHFKTSSHLDCQVTVVVGVSMRRYITIYDTGSNGVVVSGDPFKIRTASTPSSDIDAPWNLECKGQKP